MFVLVTIAWVPFRLQTRSDMFAVFKAMFGAHGTGHFLSSLALPLVLAAALMWLLPEERTWNLRSWSRARVVATGVLAGMVLIALNATSQFIYFRF
jgi:hypothetical protein